ncbi:MAG: F0F1 ATP synthase subunit A [Lachnospiraceae bacterium]|nr:F0F1 ATP synthase subunit A [Lachnospiraceae bacterium]
MNLIRADSDISLGVKAYAKYHLFGQDFYLTTTHVCILIVMAIILAFAIAVNRAAKKADPEKAPGPLMNVAEMLVEALDNLTVQNMGPKNAPKFANYIGTIAVFIFIANISGLFGLRAPTADYGVTLPLALITWVMIQFNGFKHQKMGKIKGLFEPIFLFFPINLISEFATPVSMSLRLFGNILSGTVMLSLIYGLLPKVVTLVWPAALHAYLDLFSGGIQTFVFIMLTMVFVADAIGDEETA